MAWYYGTYSCGHDGRVNIIGSTKDRQRKADYHFSGMCEECWHKQKEEERIKANMEALEKTKEMELPELQGTEKQIAWANTLRIKFIDTVEELAEKATNRKRIDDVLDYILVTRLKASWYIDNRDNFNKTDLERIFKEVDNEMKEQKEKSVEKNREKDIRMESAVFPENAITNAIVDIIVQEDKVLTKFEIHDTFVSIVKKLGYKWTGSVWQKDISETTGTAHERASELGNKLLNSGFPISILDEEIRQNAIDGNFEPECNRWIYIITEGNYKGWLGLHWEGRNENLYNYARKLTGSKWNNPFVVVKMDYYNDVEDFAELYGFKFTKKAKQAIEDYKESLKNATQVTPTKVKNIEEKDGLKEILNSSNEILEDLRDD